MTTIRLTSASLLATLALALGATPTSSATIYPEHPTTIGHWNENAILDTMQVEMILQPMSTSR